MQAGKTCMHLSAPGEVQSQRANEGEGDFLTVRGLRRMNVRRSEAKSREVVSISYRLLAKLGLLRFAETEPLPECARRLTRDLHGVAENSVRQIAARLEWLETNDVLEIHERT